MQLIESVPCFIESFLSQTQTLHEIADAIMREMSVLGQASCCTLCADATQVTDELALLDQLMQAATNCAKHHDAAGLAKVVEKLEQVSGSKISAGKVAKGATNRARLSLQHIGILSEGRLAAMKGQSDVLKELAEGAAT